MEVVQKEAINVAVIATIVEDGEVVDVSTVTTKELVFRKPNGTTLTKTASFFTDGTDGKIQYLAETDFFDVVGFWKVQGYVIFPAGFNGRSLINIFQVRDNL
jgi:hypothetical protein